MKNKQANSPQESAAMRDIAIAALEDAKGLDIRILDVQEMTDMTDFMIVATGTSDRHVKTLSDRVLEFMHAKGFDHLGVEGTEVKEWILVDFVDIVVHVMRDASRKKYDLEGLWDKTFAKLGQSADADQDTNQDTDQDATQSDTISNAS